MKNRRPAEPARVLRDRGAEYALGRGSRVSSQGQVTIPKELRERYDLTPGSEVEFESRDDGALIRRRRTQRHPIWDILGTFRKHWPKGLPLDTDAYIDWVRGGPYEKKRRRKK